MNELKSKIYELVGQASMCWGHIDKAGIFDTEKATLVAEELSTLMYRHHSEELDKAYRHDKRESAALYTRLREIAKIYQERESEYEKKVAELSFKLGYLTSATEEQKSQNEELNLYLKTVKPDLDNCGTPTSRVRQVFEWTIGWYERERKENEREHRTKD